MSKLIFKGSSLSRKKISTILTGIVVLLFFIVSLTTSGEKDEITSIESNPTPVVLSTSHDASVLVASSSTSLKHGGVLAKVVNVVDGDTIKIDTGEVVRYIGIDTPETVDPKKPVMCYGKEASNKNKELVEGKIVELENDVSETDRYGRLLRYIWIEDTLINEVLVREGYAQSSSYPPDVKYQNRFIEAQNVARTEQRGLWSSVCAITPTPSIIPTTLLQPTNETGTYTCNCAKTCAQMSSCSEAQYQLTICGCSQLDADGDGIACESDCQ